MYHGVSAQLVSDAMDYRKTTREAATWAKAPASLAPAYFANEASAFIDRARKLGPVPRPASALIAVRASWTDPVPSPQQLASINSLREKINQLTKLADDWNGWGAPAPNQTACSVAMQVATLLVHHRLTPDRVKPMADGGIFFVFDALDREEYITIEVHNDGDVVWGRFNRKSKRNEAYEHDLNDAGSANRLVDAIVSLAR